MTRQPTNVSRSTDSRGESVIGQGRRRRAAVGLGRADRAEPRTAAELPAGRLARRQRRLVPEVAWLALACWSLVLATQADVLIATNGDRFTGKVVEATTNRVVFDLEIGGRLTVPRSRIRELQRESPPAADARSPITDNRSLITNAVPAASTVVATNLLWLPPAIGHDQADWIQLKSGEWLRGRLYYIQKRMVEFDSDELKELSLDLDDVRQVYPGKPLFTKFDRRDQIYGTVVVSNDVVQVFGPEQVSLPREQLTGITPGGEREIDFWSGSLNINLSLQSGNTRQTTLSTSAELARRTPATLAQLTYLGNYSEADGVQSANNQRVNGIYNVRLNRHWFLRPVSLEYYEDQLANIAQRGTVAVGLGYYIFDRPGLEWTVSGGPGYQRTYFETVKKGESDFASTLAGVVQTNFKADITKRLKFLETIGVTVTTEEAGLYSHHAVSTLEFEIKRHLDLDVSFVWDYLQNPQAESSGLVPQHSDFRLNLGVGVRF